MVSEIQTNTGAEGYSSEAKKMLDKEMHIVKACINGLRTVDDCQSWIQAEATGQRRPEIVSELNQRKQELQDQ